MCICCHCGLNLRALEFWTILLIIALLPCTKHSRLALSEKKPKSFTTLQNGIDLFFCHFLVLIAVLCAQHRSLGPLGATDSLLSAFPHHGSSLSWSLAGVSLTGGEVSLQSVCHRHGGRILPPFTCIYQGMVQSLRWQGQLYCLVSRGGAAPLLQCFADGFGFFSGHILCGENCS